MCTFVLKYIIDYYNSLSSPVYLCFVDASKAFDRINIWHLCMKLLHRNISSLIVRFFIFWFTMQQFIVKWGSVLSPPFHSCNGLRQGGILSPIYFNVYMDDLSTDLSNLNTGCYVNDVCFNHLFYADDTVLAAPSPAALQQLISTCEQYAANNELVFNDTKTICMAVGPNSIFKNIDIPDMYLQGRTLDWVSEQKYLGVVITDRFLNTPDIKSGLLTVLVI